MTRRFLRFPLLVLIVLGSACFTALCADGGKAKNVVYEASVPSDDGGMWQLSVDTSPIIFYVGTVNNKYHVLLIRLKNNTKTPLNLSVEQDSIEFQFDDGQKVKGLLNLAGTDHATWDAMEPEIRTAIAYPQVVPAREEEGIYVYVPIGDVVTHRKKHEMPRKIVYHVNGQTVELRQRGVSKA